MSPESRPPEPTLLERFDGLMTYFGAPNNPGKSWLPMPEIGIYIFAPRDPDSPYSPSIYYQPEKVYVRKDHLDPASPYFRPEVHEKAARSLERLEELTVQLQIESDT